MQYYEKGEKRYPRVTSIIEAVDDQYGLILWAAKLGAETGDSDAWKKESKRAMRIGSITHALSERFDVDMARNGVYYAPAMKGKYAPVLKCLMAYESWWCTASPEVIENEMTLYSEEPMYAGTLDRIVLLDWTYRGKMAKGRYLIDLKTSKAYRESYGVQLAAYRYAYEKTTGQKIDGQAILRLDKETGKFGWHDTTEKNEYHLRLFMAAHNLWKVRNEK